MKRHEALEALSAQRVARLGTTRPNGYPHLVPITFALAGDTLVTMIDHKPKSDARLQRLVNIEANPFATVLADDYSEDWSALWWVRIDGEASIHERNSSWSRARSALADKYPQYADQPPEGPAIVVSLDRVSSWKSTP